MHSVLNIGKEKLPYSHTCLGIPQVSGGVVLKGGYSAGCSHSVTCTVGLKTASIGPSVV